ncbi:MAG TPA: XdhC family protein [Candidatus Acidoferrales bacterium]|nr:XdhC family protein [Candidatus Acidoferrales bacterium]
MSREFLRKSSELAAEGQPFAVATVVRVKGSSSARPGSKAIIDREGKLVMGWVGGGCAEGTVKREALECIARGRPRLITLDLTDEILGVGMPCGGVMDIYIDPVLPKPELLIVGHGRIAETLAALARLVSFSVTVDDPSADRNLFPDADRLLTDDLDLSAAPIDSRTFVVIATQHKGDHIWLQKAIEAGAAYIALISSHHRASMVLDYVAANGVAPEKLTRVWAPAGLDLGAATPEEIALSVVSQMVAVLRGGTGVPLKLKPAAGSDDERPRVVTECDAPGAALR